MFGRRGSICRRSISRWTGQLGFEQRFKDVLNTYLETWGIGEDFQFSAIDVRSSKLQRVSTNKDNNWLVLESGQCPS